MLAEKWTGAGLQEASVRPRAAPVLPDVLPDATQTQPRSRPPAPPAFPWAHGLWPLAAPPPSFPALSPAAALPFLCLFLFQHLLGPCQLRGGRRRDRIPTPLPRFNEGCAHGSSGHEQMSRGLGILLWLRQSDQASIGNTELMFIKYLTCTKRGMLFDMTV